MAAPLLQYLLSLGKTFQEILYFRIRIVVHVSIVVQWGVIRDCSGGRISLREGREETWGPEGAQSEGSLPKLKICSTGATNDVTCELVIIEIQPYELLELSKLLRNGS